VCTLGLLSISVAKLKHTSEGSAVASNVPSDISEQTTEESEDDPVSQRSQAWVGLDNFMRGWQRAGHEGTT